MTLWKKFFCCLLIFNCISLSKGFAQEGGEEEEPRPASVYGDPLGDITLVAACTVGGAILGLSTLPFTEEPGDHLKNIVVGGAVGLIIGVAAVAYMQANKSNMDYDGGYALRAPSPQEFSTTERTRSIMEVSQRRIAKSWSNTAPSLQYSFQF